MKSIVLFVFLLLPVFAQAQISNLDKAINTIAHKLAIQLNNRGIKRAGVADFTFRGYGNTRIGKYVADRLSVKIQENGARCAMTDRSVMRAALSGQANTAPSNRSIITDQTASNVQTVASKNATPEQKADAALEESLNFIKRMSDRPSNPLKNTDVIIYGDIEELGDNLLITARVVTNNKKADNIAASESTITITHDVMALMDGPAPQQQQVTPSPVPGGNPSVSTTPVRTGGMDVTPFKYENLTFEVTSCSQSGRTIEIKMQIHAAEEDVELWAYFDKTVIYDAKTGKHFGASEIRLADQSDTRGAVKKKIIADHSIEGFLRFSDVNLEIFSVSRLEIQFWGFTAELNSIPVSH